MSVTKKRQISVARVSLFLISNLLEDFQFRTSWRWGRIPRQNFPYVPYSKMWVGEYLVVGTFFVVTRLFEWWFRCILGKITLTRVFLSIVSSFLRLYGRSGRRYKIYYKEEFTSVNCLLTITNGSGNFLMVTDLIFNIICVCGDDVWRTCIILSHIVKLILLFVPVDIV